MRFGVICLNKNDCISVVASGDYDKLSDIFDIVKDNFNENEIKIIEIDMEEYENIKGDAVAIDKRFRQDFNSINNDMDFSFGDDNLEESDDIPKFDFSSFDF